MLYLLASLALPALIGLVIISVYQPAALVQHPWIEYLFWSSLGIGVFKAGLDLFHCFLVPFSTARLLRRRGNREDSAAQAPL